MRALATLTYLHARSLMVLALVLFGVAVVGSADIFERVKPFNINDPESEAVQAARAYEATTGRTAEPEVVLLISSEDLALGPAAPTRAARTLRSIPGISRVRSPARDPALISAGGDASLVLGYLEAGASRVEIGEAVSQRFAQEPEVQAGGTAVAAYQVGERSEEDARRIELYAAPVLLLLLLLVFRTFIAAMLPLIVAALSILLTFAVLRLLTDVRAIDLFALQVVTGLGVGLAIDYSLFVISRYREEIARGVGYERAHRATLASAGRTVLFSSLTVAAALASLIVFPQPFLRSTGMAGALTAVFAGATALLILPAALTILGPAVNSLSIRRARARSVNGGGAWERLARMVCRRPVPAIAVGAAVMALVASQGLETELTTPDARELPSDSTARIVAEAAEDFPDLAPTRLFAVMPSTTESEGTIAAIKATDGVTAATRPNAGGEDVSTLAISAAVDPLSEQGQAIVSEVRDLLPAGALLGGRAAEFADQRSSVEFHAPLAVVLVVISNLLILAAMTRSVVLPLLALIMNLLTVGASFGVMTAAFYSEWATDLLGTEVQPGIDISVPVLTSAVIFGLSTDYGIFLLARIREARRGAQSESEAIIVGISRTGRLITASAGLFATAVGAFVFSDLVIIKEIAVAIAIAVLLDATIVRGLLIPASLRLLDRWAWWPAPRLPAAPRKS